VRGCPRDDGRGVREEKKRTEVGYRKSEIGVSQQPNTNNAQLTTDNTHNEVGKLGGGNAGKLGSSKLTTRNIQQTIINWQ
jgi:hypothetical protein